MSRPQLDFLPKQFEDSDIEYRFRLHFAQAGHSLSVSGLSIGLALALSAMVLSSLRGEGIQNTAPLQIIRAFIAISLILAIIKLPPRADADVKDYQLWVVAPAAFAIFALGLNYLLSVHSSAHPPPAARIFLVSSLAIWLFCGFARANAILTIGITLISSLLSMWAGLLSEGDAIWDTAPYLVIANLAGLSIAIQSEKRARALFIRTHELQRTQDRLRMQKEQAIRSRDFKSQVLATVSHDLRQPLVAAGLILSTQIERMQIADASKLQRVLAALNEIDTGLERILKAAADDAAAATPNLEVLRPQDIVNEVLVEIDPIATNSSVDIHFRSHLASDVRVLTSAAGIRAILSNLIGNAIKYRVPGRRSWVLIRLLADKNDPAVAQLEVVDNGRGIPLDKANAVFIPYTRLERDGDQQGHGLGLSAVAETVAQLPNHDLVLDTRYRRGARFRVSLPIVTGTG